MLPPQKSLFVLFSLLSTTIISPAYAKQYSLQKYSQGFSEFNKLCLPLQKKLYKSQISKISKTVEIRSFGIYFALPVNYRIKQISNKEFRVTDKEMYDYLECIDTLKRRRTAYPAHGLGGILSIRYYPNSENDTLMRFIKKSEGSNNSDTVTQLVNPKTNGFVVHDSSGWSVSVYVKPYKYKTGIIELSEGCDCPFGYEDGVIKQIAESLTPIK
jgi:hypothetical protein